MILSNPLTCAVVKLICMILLVFLDEEDWVNRGIEERAYVKVLNPSIHIDPGHHNLSSF